MLFNTPINGLGHARPRCWLIGRDDNLKTFNNCTVESIDSHGSVSMQSATVHQGVDSGGSINATGSTAKKLDAAWDITLDKSKIARKVDCGDSIIAFDSSAKKFDARQKITAHNTNAESFHAGHSITINHATDTIEKIDAGGPAFIHDCKSINTIKALNVDVSGCESIRSIQSSGEVIINNSTVIENVRSPAKVTVTDSTIQGTLTTYSIFSQVKNSNVAKIFFKSIPSYDMAFRHNIALVDNTDDSNPNKSYTRFSSGNDMTYINSDPLTAIIHPKQSIRTEYDETFVKQTLELDGSTVSDVIFESENGKIMLKNGAKITGHIVGGTIIEPSPEIRSILVQPGEMS